MSNEFKIKNGVIINDTIPVNGIVDDNTLSDLGFDVSAGNNTSNIQPNQTLVDNAGAQTQAVAKGSGNGQDTTMKVGQGTGTGSSQGDNPSGDQGENKKIDLTKPFGGGEYSRTAYGQYRQLTAAQGRATMRNARQQANAAGLEGAARRKYLREEREKMQQARREARRNWLGAAAAGAPPGQKSTENTDTSSPANKRVSTPLNMWGTAKLQFGQKNK